MRRIRVCAFLALLASVSGCAPALASAGCPIQWSEPAPLVSAAGRPYYVEAPSSVVLTKGVALFGVPTMQWESPNVFLSSGSVSEAYAGVLMGRDSNTLIPLPAGVKYMLDPLGISDGRGGAHVFWGTSPAAQRSFRNQITGVAYAHFDGDRWTTPEQVVTATHLMFWRKGRDAIARNNAIDVVTTGYTTIAGAVKYGTVLVRKRGGSTEVSWDDMGVNVNYVALAKGRGDSLLTVFIATLETGTGERVYGLYAKTSARPMLVHAISERTGAYWLSAVRTRRTLHLFWIEKPLRSGTVTAETIQPAKIQHATSGDDGASFTMDAPFDLPKGTDGLEVTTLGDTVLLAVKDPASREIGIVEWQRSGWGPLRHPFREWSMSAPVFVRTSNDSIQLTWGVAMTGVVPTMPSHPAPSQRISALRRRCSGR